MPQSPIAADLGEALYVQSYLSAKVSLHSIVSIDDFSKPHHLIFSELLDARIRIYPSLRKDLLRY